MAKNMAVADYSPIVGKKQLESLILRLYSDSRTIFREYIQNACDAIYAAQKQGVLSSVEDGHVVITINVASKQIEIQDNGTGIPQEKALSTLMDIFHSGKDGIDSAGQYGIGRLAGGGYCKELIFRTTALGESVETQLSMNIQLLKKILDDPNDDRSAEQVMQHICTNAIHTANVEEHYMKVCLKDITNSSEILLDEEGITEYIRDIAPIDYQVPFKQLLNRYVPKEYKERYEAIRHIHITVNNNTNLQKRYGLKVNGNGDEIKKLRFFSLKTALYGSLAWGWYAVTPFTVQIPSSDKSMGLRLRKHNISLETNILNGYFKEERGNLYFYGEIFVDNDQIKPNSGREGLSSGDEAEALKKELKTYFETLSKVYKKANTIKNKLKNVKDRYAKYCEKESALNHIEKEALLNLLLEDVQAFKTALENPRCDEVQDICEIYLSEYNDELKDKIATLYTSAGPQTLQASQQTTKPSPMQAIETIRQSNTQKQNEIPLNKLQTEPIPLKQTIEPAPTAPITSHIITPSKVEIMKDTFLRLKEAGYSDREVVLCRKIFGFMNILCPPTNKILLEQLKEKTMELLITNQI